MNTSSNNILEIIISEVNSINDKIKGLNFLEILKINLIEKLSFINDQNISLNEFDLIEKEVNADNRSITIFIKFIVNSSITRKKLIGELCLLHCFHKSYLQF